jgi:hypothetical protein
LAQGDKSGPGSQTPAFSGCCRKFSIADPQQMLPLPELALEAHAFSDLKCRDDTPLDLLPRLSGCLACSTRLPAGLIILSYEKTFPRLFTGRIRITLEVSNDPSYNSSSMRRVLKTANKPLEIKPGEICLNLYVRAFQKPAIL